jgi:hypothetical protein
MAAESWLTDHSRTTVANPTMKMLAMKSEHDLRRKINRRCIVVTMLGHVEQRKESLPGGLGKGSLFK